MPRASRLGPGPTTCGPDPGIGGAPVDGDAIDASNRGVTAGDDIASWPEALDEAVAASRLFDRARVLRDTESTQDAARAAAGGRPGLVLVAGRQRRGRGRMGRTWEQRGDLGVALTAVVPARESEFLSMAAGAAAWAACRAALDGTMGAGRVRIKPPNDVVVEGLDAAGLSAGGGGGSGDPVARRKLAGVLIEQADGLAMIGIGVNVLQREGDFGVDVRGSACSLAMLGSSATRIDVIVRLVEGLSRFLAMGHVELAAEWAGRVAD
jgi:BirA family biotin operon repressor/biotin-[acetyl-CoA-carboxylase] ligase